MVIWVGSCARVQKRRFLLNDSLEKIILVLGPNPNSFIFWKFFNLVLALVFTISSKTAPSWGSLKCRKCSRFSFPWKVFSHFVTYITDLVSTRKIILILATQCCDFYVTHRSQVFQSCLRGKHTSPSRRNKYEDKDILDCWHKCKLIIYIYITWDLSNIYAAPLKIVIDLLEHVVSSWGWNPQSANVLNFVVFLHNLLKIPE